MFARPQKVEQLYIMYRLLLSGTSNTKQSAELLAGVAAKDQGKKHKGKRDKFSQWLKYSYVLVITPGHNQDW